MQQTQMHQLPVEGFRPSLQQIHLWQAALPGAPVALCADINEAIVPSKLRQALKHTIACHEVLRTRLHTVPGMQLPIQVIQEEAEFDWHEADAIPLADSGIEAQEADLIARMATAISQPDSPALAAALIKHGPAHFRLLLVASPVNADASSLEQLLRDSERNYRNFALADFSDTDSVQYADFAEWQHEFLASPECNAGRAFWRRQVDPALFKVRHPFEYRKERSAGEPAAEKDGSLPAPQLNHAGIHCIRTFLNPSRLLAAADMLNTTPATILLVCWSSLLQRQLGLSAITLGWRHDGRNEATQTAYGPYAKTLPLLTRQDEASPLKALVGTQDALLAEARLCHESFSPDEISDQADLAEIKALPYVFEYRAGTAQESAWRVSRVEAAVEPFLLWLTASGLNGDAAQTAVDKDSRAEKEAEKGSLELTLQYDISRFSKDAAEILLDQLATLVERACAEPDVSLPALSALSATQQERLSPRNRGISEHMPARLLHALFEEQAAIQPEAIAVKFGAQQLTYAQLNQRANQLAHRLRQEGVTPEIPVGLYAGRSLEAVVAILGILKAGGAYLPLDPGYPAERLAFMLEDTAASFILTVTAQVDTLPGNHASCVLLLDDERTYEGYSVNNPVPVNLPDNLAYIIFTSGSTGQPKGVMVSHRNAMHSTMARWHHYELKSESFLLSSSFSFDSSVAGLFWTLSQGGYLCLPDDNEVQDVEATGRLIEKYRVTHALMLPSFYGQLLETQPAARLESLKCMIVAGEAGVAALVARHYAVCPAAKLYNEYGPTEGSVWCTVYECRKEDFESSGILPIGQAIATMSVYALDKDLTQVPQGIAGEIYIGGAGITRGYLNRPALTAERFLPDPFGQTPGARLYRTGDIGRFDAAACLEFLGRVDHQVKIRGFRIELGEIENCLAQHPAVREAAVIARADKNGEARLVAYLVTRGTSPAIPLLQHHLREHLKQHLPEYMVPAVFVVLEALPLTPNGKLDRAALPEPDQGSRRAYNAPRNEVETLLAHIWADVLNTGRVGIDDNFFELGGHSLVATRLVSRVRSLMGRDISVRSVFQYPRLADFARHVLEQDSAVLPPLVPVSRQQPIPLSFAQQRLWAFDRLHPGSIVYNVLNAVRLLGELDISALQSSFDGLVRRHEALRTTFGYDEATQTPVQRIQPAAPVPLSVINISHLDGTESETELLRLLSAEEHIPFDLAQGPVLRAGLIRQSENSHVLWITLHHIVSDRWSMQVLMRELIALYEAFSQSKPSPLPELAIQYADFAIWQRQYLQGEVLQQQLNFWKGQLRPDQPPLHLPGMQPRPAVHSYRGDLHTFTIERGLAERIHALCQRQGATLFMTLLAAFKALLAIQSGESDIPAGILLANRNRLELEQLTGCFINTLVLRADTEKSMTFATYLDHIRETVVAAQANQDVPFEYLLDVLNVESNPAYSPLFQVLFDVHRDRILQQPTMGGLTFEHVPEPPTDTTHYDLMVGIGEREDGFTASFVYSTDLFDEALIARLAQDYLHVLDSITADTGITIEALAENIQTVDETPGKAVFL